MNRKTMVVGGAALSCFVIAIVLIRYEGERFRAEVRNTADTSVRDGMKEAAGHAAVKAVDRAADRIEGAIEKASELPGRVIGGIKNGIVGEKENDPRKDSTDTDDNDASKSEPSTSAGGEDVQGSGRIAPSSADAPSDSDRSSATPNENGSTADDSQPGGRENASITEVAHKQPDSDGKKNEPSRQPNIGGAFGSLFDLGNEIVQQADNIGQDYMKLSVQEKNKLGAQIHDQFKRKLKISNDPKNARRLEKLARPFLKHVKNDGTVYRFFVVDEDNINAVTHIGGYVYFYRGLMDLLQSDQRIQFVLGHEIAHGELEHASRGMTYASRANDVAGDLGANISAVAYQLLTQGYSDDEEFDADVWSCRVMMKEGGTRADAIDSLATMLKYEKQQGRGSGRESSNSDGNPVADAIDGHFRSHPSTQERIDRLMQFSPEN